MNYLTTWEDENGAEYDIKIEYNLYPAQAARTNPDDNPCPAEDVYVEVVDIYRHEPYAINGVETGMQWVEWNGESEAELDSWIIEILELDEN